MKTVTAYQGQSIFDIAIQHCGSVEASYAIAKLNSLTLDATLLPGQTLQVPEVTDRRIVEELMRRGVVPGTGWVKPPPEPDSDVYKLWLEIPYNVASLVWYDESYIVFSTYEGNLYRYYNEVYELLISGNTDVYKLWTSGNRLFCSKNERFYEINTSTWTLNLLFTGNDNRFQCSFVNWQSVLLLCYMGNVLLIDNLAAGSQFSSGSSYAFFNNKDHREDGNILYIPGATGIRYQKNDGTSGVIVTNLPWVPYTRHAWYTAIDSANEYVIFNYALYKKIEEGLWEKVLLPTSEQVLFIGLHSGKLHIVTEYNVYKLNGYSMFLDNQRILGGHGCGMHIMTTFFTMSNKQYLRRGNKILIHEDNI